MKVLFVNTNPVWGGGENWHAINLSALKASGFDVAAIVAPGSPLELRLKEEIPGVELHADRFSNLSWLDPICHMRVRALMRRLQPQVVLVSLPSDAKAVLGVARGCGVPCRIYRRGIAVPVKNSILNRHLYRVNVSDVIVNSLDTRDQLLKHNEELVKSDRIHLIYNGVATDPRPVLHDRDQRALPTAVPVQDKGLRIFHAGRLTAQKGQSFLLEVCARLRDRGHVFDCVIAGAGELEPSLRQLQCRFDLNDCVHFVGFQRDLVPWLDWADVFAMPSRFEGFGFAAVEAMLRSRPVVAADTSSLKEIVVDQETGFRVPFGDVDRFAEALVACSDPGRARQMGALGRARAQRLFDRDQAVDRLVSVILRRLERVAP